MSCLYRCCFLLHLGHRRPSPQHPNSSHAVTGGGLLAEPLRPGSVGPPLHPAGGAQPGSHGCLRPGLLPLSAVEDVTAAAGHSGAPAQQQPGSARYDGCTMLQVIEGISSNKVCFYLFYHLPASSGVRVDLTVPHSEGICGFPMVLQQITKILNHSTANKASGKTGERKHRHTFLITGSNIRIEPELMNL